MGYGRKKAPEEADRTGATLYEVRSTERTAGTLGFWWCGRFGMHRTGLRSFCCRMGHYGKDMGRCPVAK